jgi:hypothetical protein
MDFFELSPEFVGTRKTQTLIAKEEKKNLELVSLELIRRN